jgi:hypothetical protein
MGVQRALAVIDGLKTVFAAALAADEVTVVKGWEILPAGDKEHVFVGGDGGAGSSDDDLVRSTIEWPGLGGTSRTEDGTVDCAASVWTGDQTAVEATITRAYEIVGLCEDALRVNPALFEDIALQAKIVETRLRNVQEGDGYLVIVTFTVAYMSSV